MANITTSTKPYFKVTQPHQDHRAHVVIFAIIAAIAAISQIIVFVATYYQLWCVLEQRDDNPEASRTGNTKERLATATGRDSTTRSSVINPQDQKKRIPLHIFFRITTSIASFFFTLCAICSSIDTLYYSMPFIPEEYPKNSAMLGISAALTSYLGRITMSIVFIGRLHFVFRSSSMAYSKWIIGILIVLCFISFSLFLVPIIIFLEVSRWGEEAVQTFIISNVFDVCLSCFLVFLFVRKLRNVVGLHNGGANTKIVSNFLTIMSKYCVLVMTALGSTLLTILYGSVAFQSDAKISVFNGYEVALTIDSFINGFCLYLNYPFSKILYYKVCRRCDLCLRNVCQKL